MKDKNILITGGSGSFGKVFIQKALDQGCKRIVCYSRDELKQSVMQQEIKDDRVRYFIGDVRDKERLKIAFKGIDLVTHCAALKQVPACEYNSIEAVKTNILGAQNVIEAAIETGVKKVMALSTDKAVNPLNAYGASKLMAEKLFISGNSYASGTSTNISCVRYGNVVNSRGSVIPLFLKQACKGQLTVTDFDMTRFFITLDKAVDFVIKAIDDQIGGEIFIPIMPACEIFDIAKIIADKYDCEIEETGIRPGEKLHEKLIASGEIAVKQENRYVVIPNTPMFDRGEVKGKVLTDLEYSSNNAKPLSKKEITEIIDSCNAGCKCR